MINNQKAQYIINNIPACMIAELCNILECEIEIKDGKAKILTKDEAEFISLKDKFIASIALGNFFTVIN